MFKHISLGMKISFGFGALIVIAIALGGMSIWNMNDVGEQAATLAQEYVPEVVVTSDLRGAANRVMYEMRGYGFTEEEQYHVKAVEELKKVEKAMERGRTLEEKAVHLNTLNEQLNAATASVDRYKALMKETAEHFKAMHANREKMYAAADKYMHNCTDFLESQNQKFKKDLDGRQSKIKLVSELVDTGSAVRVLNFKSQATGNSQFMTDAISRLEKVGGILSKMRLISNSDADIQRMDAIERAANGYQKAMTDFLEEFSKGARADRDVLAGIRKTMDRNAAAYVLNCDTYLAGQQSKLTKDMRTGNEKINLVTQILNTGHETRVANFKSQALRDPEIIRGAMANFDKMDGYFEKLRAITNQDDDIKRIENTKVAAAEYRTAMTDFLENWLKVQDLGKQRDQTGQAVIQVCDTTVDAGLKGTEQIANHAESALSRASSIMVAGLIIAALLGGFVALFITRGITKSVNRIIAGLNESSDQVASAAGQVSGSSQSLAEGSSEQAASIEETSSSLEEMASMTKQNAQNASQADALMKETEQIVDRAYGAMKELTVGMAEISKSSEETSKIIKTIDEIAFQTNLLALNAAVEAARAGEAGAGFAVVADEVRNLAMRAAEAAKNTSDLIEGTTKRVEGGKDLTERTNEAFKEVIGSAGKVSRLVAEISTASDEQAQGIEQVNQAVVQMDKVTQQNAADAEESASAAEEMSAQSEQMRSYVGDLVVLIRGGSQGAQRVTNQPAAIHHLVFKKTADAKQDKHTRDIQDESPENLIPFDDEEQAFHDF